MTFTRSFTLAAAATVAMLSTGFAPQAAAQAGSISHSPIAAGFEIGTTGIGPMAQFAVSPNLTFTLSYGWLDSEYRVRTRAARYDSDVELSNLAAIANWHPRAGLFHVSGGLYLTDNNMKLTARPRASTVYDIGQNTYTAAQVGNLVGRVDLGNDVAPFVGVGWSTPPAKRGWGFTTTVGLMFTGSPKARFTATGPIASDPTFQADLARETQDVNDDIDYKVFPVAKAGVVYRF
jgi:hypothetical protein